MKRKNIVGFIYWHPHLAIKDFCDNFLIRILNEIAVLDNTCFLTKCLIKTDHEHTGV